MTWEDRAAGCAILSSNRVPEFGRWSGFLDRTADRAATELRRHAGDMKLLGLALAATLVATGCGSPEEPYFGRTDPPRDQRLVFLNTAEPESLDPGMHPGGREMPIINALFEGLTKMHPVTLEPMAGIATHYEPSPNCTRFTFYLRGHPSPRGIRLPNADTLREEYRAGRLTEDLSRGHAAPPDALPALWSDGRVITAHDFVYAWRRVVDPRAASPNAASLYVIRNAEDINRGRQPVAALGVRALDDFTLEVDLRMPTPFFLQLQSQRMFRAVPRHVIKEAEAGGREPSWTELGRIVTSGPFTLREWRPYDELVVVRNPRYYESALVSLDEIVFLPVDGTTAVNLYKAGMAHAMAGGSIPPEFVHSLAAKRDFRVSPVLYRQDYVINTKKPPFDNVLLRYALSMATDRPAMARTHQRGDAPVPGYILAMAGYEPIRSLPVTVQGRTYDVLAYDPKGARELLSAAGYPGGIGSDGRHLTIAILTSGESFLTEVLQDQWRGVLGVDVRIERQEFKVWIQSLIDVAYDGVAAGGWTAKYYDPNGFIDFFASGSDQSGTGWSDPTFDAMLAEANATVDPKERLRKLAACERFLLKAMPMLGIYAAFWPYLQKPYVRGMPHNPLDERQFEYAWIDAHWGQAESRALSTR
jgi:oligopeptide transport system substrate-binding protein